MQRRTFLVSALATLGGCAGVVGDSIESPDGDQRASPRGATPAGSATPGDPRESPTETENRPTGAPPVAADEQAQVADSIEATTVPEGAPLVERVQLGDGTPEGVQPHEVRIWNDGPARRLTVSVVGGEALDGGSDGPRYEREIEFPEHGHLSLSLTEQVAHRVVVGVAGGTTYGLSLDGEMVDCNASTTTVRVGPDGEVTHTTVSTMMGCPDDR